MRGANPSFTSVKRQVVVKDTDGLLMFLPFQSIVELMVNMVSI